jgi:hypothetical protein
MAWICLMLLCHPRSPHRIDNWWNRKMIAIIENKCGCHIFSNHVLFIPLYKDRHSKLLKTFRFWRYFQMNFFYAIKYYFHFHREKCSKWEITTGPGGWNGHCRVGNLYDELHIKKTYCSISYLFYVPPTPSRKSLKCLVHWLVNETGWWNTSMGRNAIADSRVGKCAQSYN